MNHSYRHLSHFFSAFPLFFPLLALLVAAFASLASANENAYKITYAKYTKTASGYNEYLQTIFIRIPEGMNEGLYIRLAHPECGGEHSSTFKRGLGDTATRFRLFGGNGACSNAALKKPSPNRRDILSGELIVDTYVSKESFRKNPWYTLARLDPERGETIDAFRYYKLVLEGENQADVNPFLIVVSRSPKRNLSSANVEVFAYVVLMRSALPGCIFLDKVSTFIREDVRGVSADPADLTLPLIGIETDGSANLPFRFPEHDGWMKGAVKVDKNNVARTCSFRFDQGILPAYGMFYITDDEGKLLPMHLPLYRKVDLQLNIKTLDDCRSVFFDASRAADPYECTNDFLWHFGDNVQTIFSGISAMEPAERASGLPIVIRHPADMKRP